MNNHNRNKIIKQKSLAFLAGFIILFIILFSALDVHGQLAFRPPISLFNPEDSSLHDDEEDVYDEVSVTLNVPRIGSIEIQAVINRQQLYLPITDLFDFLKIRNNISPDFDLVQGFFIDPKDIYTIDKTNNRILYQYKVHTLNQRDLVRTESNLYLRSDYFGKIFGLNFIFDFRSLTVTLNTKLALPAIREMQQELVRRNISKLRGERKADTTIGRTFPFLHLGMVDWAIVSSQESKSWTDTRASLGLGGNLAGGELNVLLNYNSEERINLRQQFYQWRYVNNDLTPIRQVTAGKIYTQSTSSIFAPVVGVQITNTPTSYRKSFGTYTISNTTEPEWTVELYINNVLVNFTKADASGFYTFEVPMVYGNSMVKLRFYGPWGEERTSEKYISVPFNFVPLHQFEYTVSAGVVEDNEKSRFTRANFNYGLERRLTVGAGVEYLSSVSSGNPMPFVHAALVIGSRMIVSSEYTNGVGSKTIVNYRLPSNLQFDLIYNRYQKGQTAVRVNNLDEKKLVISLPLRGKRFTSFSRLSLNQFTLPYNDIDPLKATMKYTSAEYLLSSVIAGVNSNFTTFAVLSDRKDALVYSNLSLTLRLPAGLRVTPQAQYEYRQKAFSRIKTEIEKNIFNRGFLNLSYEKNFTGDKNSLVTVGLRYNFSFAQTFFSATKIGKSVIATQSARGSLQIDSRTNYLGTQNQSQIGRGGIVVLPFLDLNGDGKKNAGEPKAFGLKLHINGGRMEKNTGDTVIRISGLEAYTSYYLELDKNSFDNIAWQLKMTTIKVIVDPNIFKIVEIPVAVVGEVSGLVSFKENKLSKGLARIIVNITNSKTGRVEKILTESDGYFSFTGLPPGEYIASVDPVQLAKLHMISSGPRPFKIARNIDGDIVSDLNFVLSPDTDKQPDAQIH
ncbi:MAG: hypothetical protein ABWZ25_06430 [Chitinophagaceae bacterium]